MNGCFWAESSLNRFCLQARWLSPPGAVHCNDYAFYFLHGADPMSDVYSLPEVIERIYSNQLALEAALMELTLYVERRGGRDVGENVRGALQTIGENAGYIRQGVAKLRTLDS